MLYKSAPATGNHCTSTQAQSIRSLEPSLATTDVGASVRPIAWPEAETDSKLSPQPFVEIASTQ